MTPQRGVHRLPARQHGAWTARWFAGDGGLASTFGPPPSLAALRACAGPVDAARKSGWTRAFESGRADVPDEEALVVLAGQQPVLGGGSLLVAHKIASAINLANALTIELHRPVIPVFLAATEDHDSSEVDHVDTVDGGKGRLTRHRCPVHPPHESFHRCGWDPQRLGPVISSIAGTSTPFEVHLKADPLASHVIALIDAVFGPLGLHIVQSHLVTSRSLPVLRRALDASDSIAAILDEGGRALQALDLPPSFDAADPRPLVLESSDGRRRRLGPDDGEATSRLTAHPDDFSPHAALRPIVQAAALPVIAQVAGPSEMLYLGQSRGLHGAFEVPPPVLVPRLEATRLPAGVGPEALEASGSRNIAPELEAARGALDEAATAFVDAVGRVDPGLAGKGRRWLEGARKGADRLAAAPGFRGEQAAGVRAFLRPRDSHQDAVLAWLPEALRGPDWAEHIVSLARPLQAPEHVAHVYPLESSSPETSHG